MPTIDLVNVTKRWGDFYAVDNLNLHTLRMIAGLETPTSGKIYINGVPVFDSELGINIPASKRHVGFLFQNYALWPHMTVQKNIEFGLQNLKEYMPVIDSDYTQYKNDLILFNEASKVVEIIKENIDKKGKVDKRRALIAIIDYFKVSMFSAKKIFDLNLEEKTPEEVKTICENKIKETNEKIDNIVKKWKIIYQLN